jgi:hypothetical protein
VRVSVRHGCSSAGERERSAAAGARALGVDAHPNRRRRCAGACTRHHPCICPQRFKSLPRTLAMQYPHRHMPLVSIASLSQFNSLESTLLTDASSIVFHRHPLQHSLDSLTIHSFSPTPPQSSSIDTLSNIHSSHSPFFLLTDASSIVFHRHSLQHSLVSLTIHAFTLPRHRLVHSIACIDTSSPCHRLSTHRSHPARSPPPRHALLAPWTRPPQTHARRPPPPSSPTPRPSRVAPPSPNRNQTRAPLALCRPALPLSHRHHHRPPLLSPIDPCRRPSSKRASPRSPYRPINGHRQSQPSSRRSPCPSRLALLWVRHPWQAPRLSLRARLRQRLRWCCKALPWPRVARQPTRPLCRGKTVQ